MNNASSKWSRRYDSILAFKRTFNAVLPAVLLALAVGQIYAFTLFSDPIATAIGSTQPKVQFAFSLGIFFLGMGAAFFGKIVEKNIKLSTVIGTLLFIAGLTVTAIGINVKSLALIYLGYGFLVGTGTGIIYISPVKTLMLWFLKHKAVAAAVPIISFGLGSSLCTLLYKALYGACGITFIFYALAVVYLVPMAIGTFLLRKPAAAVREANRAAALAASSPAGDAFSYGKLLCDGYFIRSWLFMFMNISCGLSLIPLSKQMMATIHYGDALINGVLVGCGLMNGAGRFIFAWWSDRLAHRINILLILLAVSVGVMGLSFYPILIGLTLLVINACYGAGFSTIPAVLADHFGMSNISKIHGAVLSAWGVAGLVGNQISLRVFNKWGMIGVSTMLVIGYAVNYLNVLSLKGRAGVQGRSK